MKHTTEEMKEMLISIKDKYDFIYQSQAYDNHINGKVIKTEVHQLMDKSIQNKHNSLLKLIEDNKLWGRCTLQYVNPIVLVYYIEDGVGRQYFHFPNALDCNMFDEKNCLNINTKSSFDALYSKYKKGYDELYIKNEYDAKQALIEMRKENIERIFNPNYKSQIDCDDFFTKLAKM